MSFIVIVSIILWHKRKWCTCELNVKYICFCGLLSRKIESRWLIIEYCKYKTFNPHFLNPQVKLTKKINFRGNLYYVKNVRLWWNGAWYYIVCIFFLMSVAEIQSLSSLLLPSIESKVFVSVKIYMARISSYPILSGSFEVAYFWKPSVNIVESKNKSQCVRKSILSAYVQGGKRWHKQSSTGERVMMYLFTKASTKLKKPTKDGEGPRASNSWEPLLLPSQKGQEEETEF